MMEKTSYSILLLVCILLTGQDPRAQDSAPFIHDPNTGWISHSVPADTTGMDPLDIAHSYIQAHLGEWALVPQDLETMTVNDRYTDKTSGITRIYFQQRYQGIPVHDAILNINITKAGSVFYAGNRFTGHLASRVNTTRPVLPPLEALIHLGAHLGLPREVFFLKEQTGDMSFIFGQEGPGKEDIPVGLSYQPVGDSVLLAWDILLTPAGSHDRWSARVDAINGKVLDKNNWTSYCQVEGGMYNRPEEDCKEESEGLGTEIKPVLTPATNTGAQYHVWPAPFQSPADGPRTMVTVPDDPVASPFGWHDVDGQPGADYTITRGNNAHVFQDRDDTGDSSNDEPDGGAELHFDFPFDPSWEPEQYVDAAVVNLFYWINYLHDFSYHFGFDEAAGNFQANNYGNDGAGNDFLYGITQNGANAGYSNNAIYRHNNDGKSSNIRFMIFKKGKRYVSVDAPSSLAGRYKTSIPSPGWGSGAYITQVPVTGEVVLVDDGIENPATSDGCESILNAPELAGKIALMERGGCSFGFKALQAQNAGAIGVIVINFNEDEYTMAAGPDGPQVDIPILMVGESDGHLMRHYAGHGLIVSMVDSGPDVPLALDGDLDNAIITHEFGHGITCRLAGGPNKMCLENEEQMQEGWSDFFALAFTVKPGETGVMQKGFATYPFGESTTGKGLRRYPYSTDMSINPLTYGDVAPNPENHDLGEVWASMLLDMYWALVDQYGWTSNPYDTTGGNYKAIRLVFDGLKNLPCNPGFEDGRDAILAADEALYQGENACLLWKVFARRGLGHSADQGSSLDAGDQTEAFDLPPACIDQMVIKKAMTDFIQPGDDIHVVLQVANYKPDTAGNVMVTDEIPEGTTFKPYPTTLPAVVQGNSITFHLGAMAPDQKKSLSYSLETSPDRWSQRKWMDEVPDEEGALWTTYAIAYESDNAWHITDEYPAHSGSFAWMSKETGDRSRQALELNPDRYRIHVEGQYPVMRFYHRYNTKAGLNGGVVDIREVGAQAWEPVGDDIIRNNYDGIINDLTFSSDHTMAFSGTSAPDYRATYIDLRKWMDKDIQVRFRFATRENMHDGLGWLIDDIEFMDLLAYNGEACVTTAEGDHECTSAPKGGAIVESKEDPVSAAIPLNDIVARIYPNPATDRITIEMSGEYAQEVTVSLMTLEGKLVHEKVSQTMYGKRLYIDTAHIPAGMYVLKVNTEKGLLTHKVVLQN